MKKEIIKEYTNGEITIVWEPAKCIHAGICVRTLPQVYNTKDRPWIHIANATSEQLMAQIDQCPVAALSYFKNDAVFKASEDKSTDSAESKTKEQPEKKNAVSTSTQENQTKKTQASKTNKTSENMAANETTISVQENGPLIVMGPIELKREDGTVEQKDGPTALCRCGASENKPFCDGSHKKIDWKG